MSVPAVPAELRAQVDHFGPVAYLVTVSPETGRPHVVSVAVRWDVDALVSDAGARTADNVGVGADVSLVWAPAPGESYSLIVDGPARIVDAPGGALVSIRPTGSVLHRLAGIDDGPGCIPVTTSVTAGGESGVDPGEHPNATAVRRYLSAWLDGDFATCTALAADDIVVHLRGVSTMNGTYRGHEGVMRILERFAGLGIESAELEVEDVVADDRFAMAIMRSSLQRGGERLDLRTATAYRFDTDGCFTEIWNVSDSKDAEHAFFTVPGSGPADSPAPA